VRAIGDTAHVAVGDLLHDVTFVNSDVTLAGSLAIPVGGRTSAGVVLVGGSGPSDRNNDSYFPPIRQHLVDAGIAVLSYDKRGVGGSSHDWRDASIDDLAADAIAAVTYLRSQPGLRAESTGMFGHSEGGWVVLRVAVREHVPWVITNSCPGMSPAVQDRHALANVLRQRAGASPDDIAAALAVHDRLVDAGRRNADHGEAVRLLESASVPVPVKDLLGEYWSGSDERLWEFIKRKQDHDPLLDALRLRCPHLAVFGGADELVPVADSISLFAAAACSPDRQRKATLTVEVFPQANHRVQVDDGTSLAPGFLTVLTEWIIERADSGA
jgi:pimeloyl-ACP methyl ester carboxylesterase